jgi:hypothetical protein
MGDPAVFNDNVRMGLIDGNYHFGGNNRLTVNNASICQANDFFRQLNLMFYSHGKRHC